MTRVLLKDDYGRPYYQEIDFASMERKIALQTYGKTPMVSTYSKSEKARATVGEAQQMAQRVAVPAFLAARFAMVLSLLAMVVSAIALAVALLR